MVVIPSRLWRCRAILPAMALAAVANVSFCVSAARGQQQESGFLDRIDHPDRTLHYSPSDKQFAVSSGVAGHAATVKSFAFSRQARLSADNGAFRTRAFRTKDSIATKTFATNPAAIQKFVQTDKTFGTKTVKVTEDRAANKSMPVGQYVDSNKLFLGRGRRQDTIDDLRKQKNLSIDEVREILNKNK